MSQGVLASIVERSEEMIDSWIVDFLRDYKQ